MAHCPYCDYDWANRVANPCECPRCHARLDRPKRKAPQVIPATSAPLPAAEVETIEPLPPEPDPTPEPPADGADPFAAVPNDPQTPPAPPAIVVDRPAMLTHFATWISAKSHLLKHEELKNAFRDELYAHQVEIAETYSLRYTPGTNLSVISLSALLLLDLKTDPKFAHNMTLMSAISDLENIGASRRRGKK